jgi:hypothetical protein
MMKICPECDKLRTEDGDIFTSEFFDHLVIDMGGVSAPNMWAYVAITLLVTVELRELSQNGL